MWYREFQPRAIRDCILSDDLKLSFKKMVTDGEFNSMIFTGPPGCGKTTLAKALATELDSAILFINGSENAGIDVLRTDVRQFASNMNMANGKYKIVLFDEADYIPQQSTQPALRAFIDEFSDTTRFIFTCNHPHRIIEALHSRCSTYDFTPTNKVKSAAKLAISIVEMCKEHGKAVDTKVLNTFCQALFPDYRRTINLCEKYAMAHGKIDAGILELGKNAADKLIEHILNKDFVSARSALVNISSDVYDSVYTKLIEAKPTDAMAIATIIAKYNFWSTHQVNQEICMAGCISELITEIT